MVTRLRSDKGSFVQSPKKAFDGEEGAPPGDVTIFGDVTIAAQIIAQGMISGGDCQAQFITGTMTFSRLTADVTLLDYDLSAGVFTDSTSLTTWEPAIAPYDMSLECVGSNNFSYWDPGTPPVGAYHEHIMSHTGDAVNRFIDIATHHVQFPGAAHPFFTAAGRWQWVGPAP